MVAFFSAFSLAVCLFPRKKHVSFSEEVSTQSAEYVNSLSSIKTFDGLEAGKLSPQDACLLKKQQFRDALEALYSRSDATLRPPSGNASSLLVDRASSAAELSSSNPGVSPSVLNLIASLASRTTTPIVPRGTFSHSVTLSTLPGDFVCPTVVTYANVSGKLLYRNGLFSGNARPDSFQQSFDVLVHAHEHPTVFFISGEYVRGNIIPDVVNVSTVTETTLYAMHMFNCQQHCFF